MALKRLKVKHEFLHSGLITTGILAVATGIGFLFQSLGFTEENIIIVYVLGVLVIAFLAALIASNLAIQLKDGGADTDAFGDESDLTESRRCG